MKKTKRKSFFNKIKRNKSTSFEQLIQSPDINPIQEIYIVNMLPLNDFELAILNQIAMEYPFLLSHIPHLQITKRECTGVGMFVHFSYLNNKEPLAPIPAKYYVLGSEQELKMSGLNDPLVYEINITEGKIDVLEVVTINEKWDGTINSFKFVEP